LLLGGIGAVISLKSILPAFLANFPRPRSSMLAGSPMKPTSMPRLAAILLAVWALLALPAATQDGVSRLKNETEHLQQALANKPVSDPDWKDARPDMAAALARASDAQRAGQLYLGLEELREARISFQALDLVKQKPEVVKQGLAGFDSEWGKAKLELAALDQKAKGRVWTNAPAAIRAFSEAAQGKTMTLLEASRAYASVTSPDAGLYYLGEARASADFASFCSALDLPRHGAEFPAHSISPQLQVLQERTNSAFRPPRSGQQHREFIRLNATLKLAGELDAAKLYAGAFYEYLDAAQQFGMLNAVVPDVARKSALRGTLATLRTRLSPSMEDESIAQLFLERAEARLRHEPAPKDWENVRIIVEQVLPAYFAAAQKTGQSPKQPTGNTVTVTLVRWPYT
jgi:hypothetical protein